MSSGKDTGANLGQSAGARAIEARAAIATAQLRTTVTSISSSVGSTSSHGERIVETIDDLVDDVMPELEAAEALVAGDKSGRGASAASRSSVWVEPGTVGAPS